jgi:hypothetical protein
LASVNSCFNSATPAVIIMHCHTACYVFSLLWNNTQCRNLSLPSPHKQVLPQCYVISDQLRICVCVIRWHTAYLMEHLLLA